MKKLQNLDSIRSWLKDNSFVFQSSEIYGGMQAVYDYGHYGLLLKKNIEALWWKQIIQKRDDVVSLDSAIFMQPKTWVASGHVGSFSDVLIEDKKTHIRYRADHYLEEWLGKNLDSIKFELVESEKIFLEGTVNALKKGDMDKVSPEEIDKIIAYFKIKSPSGSEFSTAKNFNLLVKSNLGSITNSFLEEDVVYLRGETCQGIYLNFLNTFQTLRKKLPFGIAQVGKAFRNEITARQFIFRTREFEQMEMQYFCHKDDTASIFESWKNFRHEWYTNYLNIPKENIRFKNHEKLAHYASEALDIEYKFESLGGFKEIEGVHARGDWDLSHHEEFSGVNHTIFDPARNEKYLPHIVETSVGLNRVLLMLVEEFLEDELLENGTTRTVFRLNKNLAPIKIAILPLSKKEALSSLARQIKETLSENYICEYDDTASIGKRYRRQDEIGTPFCITIDFDTLTDFSVTIRDRDTMKQQRILIADLKSYMYQKFGF